MIYNKHHNLAVAPVNNKSALRSSSTRKMEDDAMDMDAPGVEASSSSSPIARKTLHKFQEQAPNLHLNHFLYLCSYLKILFDLGYKPPHHALDAFITQYQSWSALGTSNTQPYHVWFSENGPGQAQVNQILSNYLLAAICQENDSYVRSLNDDFSKITADFIKRNPAVLEEVTPPRPAPSPPTMNALEFMCKLSICSYHTSCRVLIKPDTPNLEKIACHAPPIENEVVRLSTALDPVSNRLRIVLKRGEIVVGKIVDSDKTRSLPHLNKEVTIFQKQDYTSLAEGGRCCTGLVVLKDAVG